jgi:hypothetical protein
MHRMERKYSLFLAVVMAGAGLVGATPLARAQPLPTVRVSPALPAEGDAMVISADFYIRAAGAGPAPASVSFNQINLPVTAYSPWWAPYSQQHFEWPLPALPAGAYTFNISVNGIPDSVVGGLTVRPRTAALGLAGGRFQVTLAAGQAGANPAAVQLSDAGGYFSFFSSADVEITVKMVDGRPVNGRFWVFIASMTTTPFTVTIVDTSVAGCVAAANCPARTYTNPAGSNRNFIDVSAF